MSTVIMMFILPLGILLFFWDKKNYAQSLAVFRDYIVKMQHADFDDEIPEDPKALRIVFFVPEKKQYPDGKDEHHDDGRHLLSSETLFTIIEQLRPLLYRSPHLLRYNAANICALGLRLSLLF